jgi:hypothetical protein
VVVAVIATALGYQSRRAWILPTGPSVGGEALLEGFFPAEGELRWSAARARVRFPDPPPGAPVRVELDLAGLRPRGQAAPLVRLAAGDARTSARPDRRGMTVSLEAVPTGAWHSELVVELESETFSPGGSDPRRLGVQLRGARLVPLAGTRRPPLAPLARSALIAFLVLAIAMGLDARRRLADALGLAAGLACGALQGLAPLQAAVWSPLVAASLAGIAAVMLVRPSLTRAARDLAAEVAAALALGVRRLAGAPMACVLVLGALGVVAAHRLQPEVAFPIGSDRSAWLTSGFGPFDAADGRTFRSARGARLDLRDFGGGSSWRVVVDSSALQPGSPWTSDTTLDARPSGWRPGPVLTLGDPGPRRVAQVTVDRQGGWPALRLVVCVALTGVLFGVGLAAAGLAGSTAIAGAALFVAGEVLALGSDPGVVIPFAPTMLAILAGSALCAAVLAACGKRYDWRNAPVVIAATASGLAAWLASTTFPLYRGGHFLFHSAIAEEIWKGRFLIYYLPYPGSMLSQQAQWGNVVVPHPALYQTLVSPLAAWSRPTFLLSEKVLLALLLASLVVVAARLAARLAGPAAGAWAAVVFVGLVPGYQLLGLGHLMTILGVWASSLALLFLAARVERLGNPWTWRAAVLLLTSCFLSYFAALLFTGLVLVLYLGWLARREPARVRPLFTALVAATALSFGLYYAYWFWPFLSESLPALVAGGGSAGPARERYLMSRLLSEPGKFDYSYGSLFIPLAAFAGLASLRRAEPRQRCLVVLWLSILPIVTGMDLFFNFLLKHHYYVMVPVAVGVGALLERIARLGRPGRAIAVVLVLLVLGLGADTAVEVALGLIP